MNKLKTLLYERRFFFGIFAFILFYMFAVVGHCSKWEIDESIYSMYALDFSFGFVSRVLPGALYNLIFPALRYETLFWYETALYLLFFAGLAAFLARLLRQAAPEQRGLCCVLIFLFITGPTTFSIYVTDMAIPEVYWVFCAALFFLFLAYKPLYPLIVPLCAVTLLVNYLAILCFVPAFCILILYKLTVTRDKREKALLAVSFFLSAAVSIAVFLYFVFTFSDNLVYSFEDFQRILRERGAENLFFPNSIFYQKFDDLEGTLQEQTLGLEDFDPNDPVQKFLYYLKLAFVFAKYYFTFDVLLGFLIPVLLVSPVLYVVVRFCFRQIADRQNPALRRFVFFCMAALPLFTNAVAFFTSMNHLKWFAFSYLCLLGSFLYVYYCERDDVYAYLREIRDKGSGAQLAAYCCVYSFSIFSAYF